MEEERRRGGDDEEEIEELSEDFGRGCRVRKTDWKNVREL